MVNVIFKELDVEALIDKIRNCGIISKALSFIKSNKIFVKATSLLLSGVIALVVTIVSVGITVGFNVKYSGKVIATVHDSSVFEDAKNIATENMSNSGADVTIGKPRYTLTLTIADKLDNAAKVADAIIENSDVFVYGTAIKVNGKTIAITNMENIAQKLEDRKNSFNIEGAQNSASFVDEIELEEGYFLQNKIDSSVTTDIAIGNLKVKTVSRITEDVTIKHGTRTIRTSAKPNGYNKVTTEGENGTRRYIEEVECINGIEVNSTEISREIIKKPVTKVVTIGTGTPRVAATERAKASSVGFICPMNSGTYVISAYWGDGRNHKALDFAADTGTPIFAAKSGTVTYSGYDSDYGYNLIIDHGNGYKTRYAHANALCVKSGDRVSQGDMIATVGNTGRSTGSHLHFEVIVNGTRVNPAPYVGK